MVIFSDIKKTHKSVQPNPQVPIDDTSELEISKDLEPDGPIKFFNNLATQLAIL